MKAKSIYFIDTVNIYLLFLSNNFIYSLEKCPSLNIAVRYKLLLSVYNIIKSIINTLILKYTLIILFCYYLMLKVIRAALRVLLTVFCGLYPIRCVEMYHVIWNALIAGPFRWFVWINWRDLFVKCSSLFQWQIIITNFD